MSFVRREVLENIKQYQEVLWGFGVLAIGILALITGGFITIISIPILIAGIAVIFFGARRAKFRSLRSHSPISDGVVEMVEQELTFFSSGIGATIATDEVVKIEIETTRKSTETENMFWMFYQRGQKPVRIPSGAVGADELFDALVAFPGANYDKVIAATQTSRKNRFLIWQDENYFSRRSLH